MVLFLTFNYSFNSIHLVGSQPKQRGFSRFHVKARLLAKIRNYKSDLNNIKSKLKKISAPNAQQATREELLEAGMADALAVSSDQRGRLMMTSERLNQSADRIRESKRTVLETEDINLFRKLVTAL